MTEKRFYYNTFYHADDMSRVLEYEIIDRQSYPNYPHHDEKKEIPKWYIYIGENDSGWQDMLVDLLNNLHEENIMLREEIKDFQDLLASKEETLCKPIIQENQRLETENNRLIVTNMGLNTEYEWLKVENRRLKGRIQEYEEQIKR